METILKEVMLNKIEFNQEKNLYALNFIMLWQGMIPKSETYWYFGIEGAPIEIYVISENIEKYFRWI